MNVLKLQRKFPQFQQGDIFGLTDAFRKLDVDDKGYIDEATAIKATQQSERQPYDVVRQALKEVELDSSRRVELEDYVGVSINISTKSDFVEYETDADLRIAYCEGPRRFRCAKARRQRSAVLPSRRHLPAHGRPRLERKHRRGRKDPCARL